MPSARTVVVALVLAGVLAFADTLVIGQGASGQWSPAFSMPLVAVHGALMPTGELLLFDAWEIPGTPSARLWNPTADTYTHVPNGFAELFCAGHFLSADGRLLTVGGHNGAGVGTQDATNFDPTTNLWTALPDLNYARWYPTLVQLADGRALAMGGAVSRPANAEVPETLNLAGGGWTPLPTLQKDVGEYPQMFQAPDGGVFVGGSWLANPSLTSWTPVGQGAPAWGTAVMYRPGKVMMTGGGSQGADPVTGDTAVIDLNAPTPTWRPTARMTFGRSQHTLVILPDGKVLVVGGAAEVSLISTNGVLPAEIWDPDTEAWTQVASMTHNRMYHSIAMLLPDGRVLAAGGGRINPVVTDESNGEFYSPPYLFRGARPVATSVPAAVGYGSTFDVGTPAPGAIARVTLVRTSSVTHGLNMDQRFFELPFTTGAGGLSVTAPSNPNSAPAGDYLLFLLDANDVPSIGRFVRLGGTPVAASLSINDVSVNEGTGAGASMVFTVTLSSAQSQTVSVHYATSDGTALAGSDYASTSGTATFPPGTTARTIAVPVVGDAIPEANETLTVSLSSPAGAVIADGIGIGTIVNDDVAVPSTLAIGSATVTEGSGTGQTIASFTVALTPASPESVLVSYRTLAGSAVSPADFTSTSGTLTFAGGTTSQAIQVPIVRDVVAEGSETFSVELYNPVQATIATAIGTGTILDDDSGTVTSTFVLAAGADDVNEDGATFTPDGTTVWLGTGGTPAQSYTGLRFSGVTVPRDATIVAAHLDVTSLTTQWSAMAFEIGAEASGNSAPFTASLPPSARALVAVRVNHLSDAQWVAGTQYSLDDMGSLIQAVVQQPSWASGQALAIILRGTGSAWGRKHAASVESGSATAPRLVVSYTSPQTNLPPVITSTTAAPTTGVAPLVVDFSGAATDPEGAPLTYTWAFGDGRSATGASVQHTYAAAGTFGATLTVSDGTQQAVSSPIAIHTSQGALPTLSVSDVTVVEGTSGSSNAVFTVSRTTGGSTVSVSYATVDGTATAPSDFTAVSGVLTLTGPTLTGTISVPIVSDAVSEPNETLTLLLSNPVGATIAKGSAVGTIVNDDGGGNGPPTLSISDVTIAEGASGHSFASFVVSLSAPTAATVHYATVDGTAVAPGDYGATSGTLSFSGSVTSQLVAVPIVGDTAVELDETFQVVLSNPTGATLAVRSATGTIANDDAAGGPSAPHQLHLTVQGQQAMLGWTPGVMPLGSTFVVEVGTHAGASDIGRFGVGTLTQIGGALPPGTYDVRVRAVSPAGQSAVSSEAQFTVPSRVQPPAAPGALSAWVVGNAVTLSWDTAPGNPQTYILDVGSASGLTDITSFVTGGVDTVLQTPAPPGVYFVHVRAVNPFGSSGPSNEVRVVVR